jgi:hypothetical protein
VKHSERCVSYKENYSLEVEGGKVRSITRDEMVWNIHGRTSFQNEFYSNDERKVLENTKKGCIPRRVEPKSKVREQTLRQRESEFCHSCTAGEGD